MFVRIWIKCCFFAWYFLSIIFSRVTSIIIRLTLRVSYYFYSADSRTIMFTRWRFRRRADFVTYWFAYSLCKFWRPPNLLHLLTYVELNLVPITIVILDHGPIMVLLPLPLGGIFHFDFLIAYIFWNILVYVTRLCTGAFGWGQRSKVNFFPL